MLLARTSTLEKTWVETISRVRGGAGKPARKILGAVHSSFTHALNIRIFHGREANLLTIHTRGACPSPGALICDLEELPRFLADTPVMIDSTSIVCGELQILLTDYKVEDCSIYSLEQFPEYQLSNAWGTRLEVIWELNAARGSFLVPVNASEYQLLLSKYLNKAANTFKCSVEEYMLDSQPRASNNADSPLRVLPKNNTVESISSNVLKLIGLGSGLTPSGDDYLVGWLSIIYLDRDFDSLKLLLTKTILENIDATTDVSQHYLRAALSGNFHWDVKHLAIAARYGIEEGLELKFKRLMSLGSTSGSDSALGIVHAIQTLTYLTTILQGCNNE